MTLEVALVTALLAGFFGSTHCIGMCGPVVLLLEQPGKPLASAWLQRLLCNIGRALFYALLGTIAGLSGAVLAEVVGIAAGLTALRIVAALLVIAIGLNLLCNWQLTRFLETAGAGLWQKLSALARHVLPPSTPPRALAAGFIWGALPCGLVYSAVAMAAAVADPISGALLMLTFWLGTLPALLLAGASAVSLRRWRASRWLRRAAGMLIIVLGLAALWPLATRSDNDHHHHAGLISESAQESAAPC